MQPVTDKKIPTGMEGVVADVAASQKSNKTTVQTLTYTTTDANGQPSTCTATYPVTLSNVGSNGKLNKPDSSGVNFKITPPTGTTIKPEVKRKDQ